MERLTDAEPGITDLHVHIQPWEMLRPEVMVRMKAGRKDLKEIEACTADPGRFLRLMDAEGIDRAMELGYKHPMGPLRLTDLVGLDVRLAIAEHLHRTLGGDQYRPPEVLRRKVAEGKLGKKTGEGFYRWNE